MEKLLLFLNRPDLTQGAVDRAFDVDGQGIGKDLALTISDARKSGPFLSREDLKKRVRGLGAARLALMDDAVERGAIDSLVTPEQVLAAYFGRADLTPAAIDEAFEVPGYDIGRIVGNALIDAALAGNLNTLEDFLNVPGIGPAKLNLMLELAGSGLLFQNKGGLQGIVQAIFNSIPNTICELTLPKFRVRYREFEFDPEKIDAECEKSYARCAKDIDDLLVGEGKIDKTKLSQNERENLDRFKVFWSGGGTRDPKTGKPKKFSGIKNDVKECDAVQKQNEQAIEERRNKKTARQKKINDAEQALVKDRTKVSKQVTERDALEQKGGKKSAIRKLDASIARLRKKIAKRREDIKGLRQEETTLALLGLEKKCLYDLAGFIKQAVQAINDAGRIGQGKPPGKPAAGEEEVLRKIGDDERAARRKQIGEEIERLIARINRLRARCLEIKKLREKGDLKGKCELLVDRAQSDLIRAAGQTELGFEYCFYWQKSPLPRAERKEIERRNKALAAEGKATLPLPERCAMRFIRVQPVAKIDINPKRPLYIRAKKSRDVRKNQARISAQEYEGLSNKERQAWCLAAPYSIEAHERAHVCDFFEELKRNWKFLIPVEKVLAKSVLPDKTVVRNGAEIPLRERERRDQLNRPLNNFRDNYIKRDKNAYPHGTSEQAAINFQRQFLKSDKADPPVNIFVELVKRSIPFGAGALKFAALKGLYNRKRNLQALGFEFENRTATKLPGTRAEKNSPICPDRMPDDTFACLGAGSRREVSDKQLKKLIDNAVSARKKQLACPFTAGG